VKRNILLFVLLGIATGCGSVTDESVGSQAEACDSTVEDIITNDHFVTVSNGATLHVVEKYAAGALHGGRRHALLMLPATLVTSAMFNAAVPGHPEFNALERGARAGFISYTLDYEGYGTSSHPADGKTVTFERMVEETGDLVRWIRHRHHVSKVDMIGASLGSLVAVALGGRDSPIPRGWVGGVVVTASIYKTPSPLLAAVMFNPATKAAFLSLPGGYFPTDQSTYVPVLYAAEEPAFNWCLGAFPGSYAIGPTLEGFDLPVIDASRGRASMLQFWGDADLMTPLSDAQQFQAEYGGPHTLVTLPGGAHTPHLEPVRDQFWATTFAFLDGEASADDDDDDEDHDHGHHH
jgi:hypothetical protein